MRPFQNILFFLTSEFSLTSLCFSTDIFLRIGSVLEPANASLQRPIKFCLNEIYALVIKLLLTRNGVQ